MRRTLIRAKKRWRTSFDNLRGSRWSSFTLNLVTPQQKFRRELLLDEKTQLPARRSVGGRTGVRLGTTAQRLVVRARLNQRNVLIGKSRTQRIEHTSSDDVPIFGLCGCHELLPNPRAAYNPIPYKSPRSATI